MASIISRRHKQQQGAGKAPAAAGTASSGGNPSAGGAGKTNSDHTKPTHPIDATNPNNSIVNNNNMNPSAAEANRTLTAKDSSTASTALAALVNVQSPAVGAIGTKQIGGTVAAASSSPLPSSTTTSPLVGGDTHIKVTSEGRIGTEEEEEREEEEMSLDAVLNKAIAIVNSRSRWGGGGGGHNSSNGRCPKPTPDGRTDSSKKFLRLERFYPSSSPSYGGGGSEQCAVSARSGGLHTSALTTTTTTPITSITTASSSSAAYVVLQRSVTVPNALRDSLVRQLAATDKEEAKKKGEDGDAGNSKKGDAREEATPPFVVASSHSTHHQNNGVAELSTPPPSSVIVSALTTPSASHTTTANASMSAQPSAAAQATALGCGDSSSPSPSPSPSPSSPQTHQHCHNTNMNTKNNPIAHHDDQHQQHQEFRLLSDLVGASSSSRRGRRGSVGGCDDDRDDDDEPFLSPMEVAAYAMMGSAAATSHHRRNQTVAPQKSNKGGENNRRGGPIVFVGGGSVVRFATLPTLVQTYGAVAVMSLALVVTARSGDEAPPDVSPSSAAATAAVAAVLGGGARSMQSASAPASTSLLCRRRRTVQWVVAPSMPRPNTTKTTATTSNKAQRAFDGLPSLSASEPPPSVVVVRMPSLSNSPPLASELPLIPAKDVLEYAVVPSASSAERQGSHHHHHYADETNHQSSDSIAIPSLILSRPAARRCLPLLHREKEGGAAKEGGGQASLAGCRGVQQSSPLLSAVLAEDLLAIATRFMHMEVDEASFAMLNEEAGGIGGDDHDTTKHEEDEAREDNRFSTHSASEVVAGIVGPMDPLSPSSSAPLHNHHRQTLMDAVRRFNMAMPSRCGAYFLPNGAVGGWGYGSTAPPPTLTAHEDASGGMVCGDQQEEVATPTTDAYPCQSSQWSHHRTDTNTSSVEGGGGGGEGTSPMLLVRQSTLGPSDYAADRCGEGEDKEKGEKEGSSSFPISPSAPSSSPSPIPFVYSHVLSASSCLSAANATTARQEPLPTLIGVFDLVSAAAVSAQSPMKAANNTKGKQRTPPTASQCSQQGVPSSSSQPPSMTAGGRRGYITRDVLESIVLCGGGGFHDAVAEATKGSLNAPFAHAAVHAAAHAATGAAAAVVVSRSVAAARSALTRNGMLCAFTLFPSLAPLPSYPSSSALSTGHETKRIRKDGDEKQKRDERRRRRAEKEEKGEQDGREGGRGVSSSLSEDSIEAAGRKRMLMLMTTFAPPKDLFPLFHRMPLKGGAVPMLFQTLASATLSFDSLSSSSPSSVLSSHQLDAFVHHSLTITLPILRDVSATIAPLHVRSTFWIGVACCNVVLPLIDVLLHSYAATAEGDARRSRTIVAANASPSLSSPSPSLSSSLSSPSPLVLSVPALYGALRRYVGAPFVIEAVAIVEEIFSGGGGGPLQLLNDACTPPSSSSFAPASSIASSPSSSLLLSASGQARRLLLHLKAAMLCMDDAVEDALLLLRSSKLCQQHDKMMTARRMREETGGGGSEKQTSSLPPSSASPSSLLLPTSTQHQQQKSPHAVSESVQPSIHTLGSGGHMSLTSSAHRSAITGVAGHALLLPLSTNYNY